MKHAELEVLQLSLIVIQRLIEYVFHHFPFSIRVPKKPSGTRIFCLHKKLKTSTDFGL